MQLFKVETFKVNAKIYHILIIQFKPTSVFIKRLASWLKLRIAQHDLVESIKNTNTEACSDDLSSDRLSSFSFKAIKMHSSGFQFSFGTNLLFLFSHPISMFVFAAWSLDLARRHQIYKIPCLFPLPVSAFDELLATLVDDSSFFLLTSIWIMS